ncbi:MAG TPA: heat-inducible transcription repressor HrcA [Firmicutes bacterium]|nr:heat-inducible transcription repressor HrcA [Bacillota bacterium]
MDERKRKILKAVTRDYIDTAEPVGSRTIARRYGLGVSPATIRNEMADLEEDGYLEQPHTSAGRIPSEKGYRFYVDVLMTPRTLSRQELQKIYATLQAQQVLEDIVQESVRLLALLSQYTSIVVAPNLSRGTVRCLQLIPLDEFNVLLVLVVDPGFSQSRIVETSRPLTAQELARINHFFERRLAGAVLADIGASLIEELRDEIDDEALLSEALNLLIKGLRNIKKEQVFIDGTTHLLSQPEFKNIEKAKGLLNILDDERAVWSVLNRALGRSGILVTIGSENPHEGFQECSLVTATYEINGQVVGSIGVIGPTRMDYDKAVSIVEGIANSLSSLLSDPRRH